MSKLLNFSMRKIKEGFAEIFVPKEEKISKKLPVFYNPIMQLNRDITILLLQQFSPMNLCDPLAGSGIRAIRFTKELKYKSIIANDLNEKATALIKKNMRHNKVKFVIKNEDANVMLLKSKGFDFIDLDVFGSSNFMLDSSIKRISRNGILAVTNTDTAALTGTYPKACKRKYWSSNKKNYLMHETGLRILIRKVQLVGMQYEKALFPIFSYFKDHYFRVFFECVKGKKLCDEIALQHGMFDDVGPLWLGNLWDSRLVGKMYGTILKNDNENQRFSSLKLKILNNEKTNNTKNSIKNNEINNNYSELLKFLKIIKDEAKINVVGFYDLHDIAGKKKLGTMARKQDIIKKIKKKGFKVSETHFSGTGIRSDILYNELLSLLKE
tara:strand:- start:7711 stop:8856 length:1146 start_codon:yes stop_codon:yes gene_type:complete